MLAAGSVQAAIVVTDAAGREVRLQQPAQRIVTNEAMLLLALALLDPDPVSRMAGWARPQRLDSGIYASFRERFAQIDALPAVGGVVPANVSAEAILSVAPDLYVVSLWDPGWQVVADALQRIGVPTLYLDGPHIAELSPEQATAFQMRLLGQVLGREKQAEAYVAFIQQRYRAIAASVDGQAAPLPVLVDVHAGTLCCYTPGRDNRISEFLRQIGGRSIGDAGIGGYDGQLNPEAVLAAQPALYVGTGGPAFGAQGGILLGGGVSVQAARASLGRVTQRNLLDHLSAVRSGRVHAISHQLAISALSIVTSECMAHWLHPQRFPATAAEQTLAYINQHFLAVPLSGTFCVSLDELQTDNHKEQDER